MKKLSLIAGISVALLSAIAVYAAPAVRTAKTDTDGNGSVSKAEAMAAADARFAKMDVNADGILNTADREAKVKQRFAEMDADKNGSINEAEFVAGHAKERGGRDMAMNDDGGRHGKGRNHGAGRHGEGGGREGGRGMKMLGLADTNNDQAVSAQEFRAAYAANFAKADSNNDGAISTDERKAMRVMLRGERRGGAGAGG